MTADAKTTDLAEHDLDRVEGGWSRGESNPINLKDERPKATAYAEGWAGVGASDS